MEKNEKMCIRDRFMFILLMKFLLNLLPIYKSIIYLQYLLACPNLAHLIEEGEEEKLTSYLQELLRPFQKEKIESVVLGCTHYPLISEKIKNVLGEVKFYDGGKGIANHLFHLLETNHQLNVNKAKKEVYFEDSSHNRQKEERFFAFLTKE